VQPQLIGELIRAHEFLRVGAAMDLGVVRLTVNHRPGGGKVVSVQLISRSRRLLAGLLAAAGVGGMSAALATARVQIVIKAAGSRPTRAASAGS